MPPLAMPGLPVGLMHTRPSGAPITVRAPLSTRSPRRAARERARSSRCDRPAPSSIVAPSMRAISPGMRRETRGPARRRSRSRCPASALSASASTTIGRGTRAPAPAPAPASPGPARARAERHRVAPGQLDDAVLRPRATTHWPAVSGSASVMASGAEPPRWAAGTRARRPCRDPPRSGARRGPRARRRRSCRASPRPPADGRSRPCARPGRAAESTGDVGGLEPQTVTPRATSSAGTPMSTTTTRPGLLRRRVRAAGPA